VSETMGMSMHPLRGMMVPLHTVMVSPTSYARVSLHCNAFEAHTGAGPVARAAAAAMEEKMTRDLENMVL
jgi:hypothetical protein